MSARILGTVVFLPRVLHTSHDNLRLTLVTHCMLAVPAAPAGGELEASEAHAQELVDQVQQLQLSLEKSTSAAQLQAEEAAQQHRALQQQLLEQQAQLEQDREAIESLQEQAHVAKRELALQQQLAEGLQEQSVALQEQLQSTAAAKMAAEERAHHLAGQLSEAKEEMTVLQHAQVRSERHWPRFCCLLSGLRKKQECSSCLVAASCLWFVSCCCYTSEHADYVPANHLHVS